MIHLVLPWRLTADRMQAMRAAAAEWSHLLPEAFVHHVDAHPKQQFQLAASRNMGVRLAELADVVVVSDADTYVQRSGLREAIEAVGDGLIHRPFTDYYRARTKQPVRPTWGQVYVCRPQDWWAVGGQDERFRWWGPEDQAFAYAHYALHGEWMPRHRGSAFSGSHGEPVQPSPEDRRMMQELVLEQRLKISARTSVLARGEECRGPVPAR